MEVQSPTLSILSSSLPAMSAVTSLSSTTQTHLVTPPKTEVESWDTITSKTSELSPDEDPYPSWVFYPPSATYIPPTLETHPTSPTSIPTSPTKSPRSSPPPTTHVNGQSGSSASSAPSTHHRILDHCFHLSIETRLKQAEAQYLASIQEGAVEKQIQAKDQDQKAIPNNDTPDQTDWQKRQRSLVDEAVVLGRKGSNVEAIVDGILKSHRSSGPLQTLPRHLKHRLHLCQLTSMVYGRFDVSSSANTPAGLNIYSAFHSRRHGTSRAAIKQRFSNSEQGKILQSLLQEPIPASHYCRRHHRQDCKRTCCTLAKLQQEQQQALELKKKIANNYYMNNVRKPEHAHQRVTGLIDAIPAFLKCSAMSYRDIAKGMVDKGELKEVKDINVLEGWYSLLLEMMTQAAIESNLCDEDTGFDTILDVFSFGDDPDGVTAVLKNIDIESNSVATSQLQETTITNPLETGVEELQFQSLNGPGSSTMPMPLKDHLTSISPMLHDVITQDRQDDILFAKTPQYEAFKKAKDERLQEFLSLKDKNKEQHFAHLAAKYPLIIFERQMTHFIARCQKLLVDPKLSSQNVEPMGFLIPRATPTYADGSLSMPVSEDEDDEDDDMRVNHMEKIKEVDENETIDEQQKPIHCQQFPTPPASIVVVSRGDTNDDDNSTAARVVQMPKKHKLNADNNTLSQAVDSADDENISKKAKLQ